MRVSPESPDDHVGSDTGGTFTDLVTATGSIAKVPSSAHAPATAVADGLAQLGLRPRYLGHGTTVATNAVLERRGAKLALITNTGLEDVIEIARQDRPSLYDRTRRKPVPLVARELRFGIGARLDARGGELQPVDSAEIEALLAVLDARRHEIDSLAVCLLHSDLNPDHESTVARWLRAAGWPVSASSEVVPLTREYERTNTTVLDAYIGPRLVEYLGDLAPLARAVGVVTSSGGVVPIAQAQERPVGFLLSGPAAGVRAAALLAAANGVQGAVTLDMGGTSTDVALIVDGRPVQSYERNIGGFPLQIPSVDVLTIGAGGGSMAWIDSGGALRVGPQSAGSQPGPACYGRGGTAPTVTDANLVAGRLGDAPSLPGIGLLDVGAARRALVGAGADAGGVLAVVNHAIARALAAVTFERGHDTRELVLIAFGGAGPQHACALADELGFKRVLIPDHAGVLCALGALAAPLRVDLVANLVDPLDHPRAVQRAQALASQAVQTLPRVEGFAATASTSTSFLCRYRGQVHDLAVDRIEGFHELHRARNGYAREGEPIAVAAVQATAERHPQLDLHALWNTSTIEVSGPRVIVRGDCTIWVAPGWRTRGAVGALWLEREDA